MDYHSVLLNAITATINPQGTTILFVLLLGLLFSSFVVSGAEVAFFSLTYKDINLIKTKQQQPYKRILRLLEEPKILLGSLLIANSFINIAIIIISNILIDDLFAFAASFTWVEFIIKVIAVTSLLVLFAEVMPKVLATQNNIRFAKEMGPLVDFLQYLFKGMSKSLVTYSDVIERKLSKKSGNAITNEELYHAIDITDNGSNENEKNILKGILSFGDITAKQIMKARLDVHGIDYNATYNEVLTQVKELHYSRIPVYSEDLDDIKGLLHTKDLIPFINENNSFNWHSLIRPPYFVHEQKMIEDLLREFQNKHIHFAFVVDEFGGTSGIITLEDILEEVIGDIKDEFDEDELGFKKIDDNNYVFEGRTMINDVCKIMSLNTDTFDTVKGESDSLAGLVLEIAGKIPDLNEIISIGDFEFTVLDVERTRINKIKVTIKPQTEE
ncbi:MAG: gliding motility-associated protein GldE [Bacteroidetes bacterium]|nr:gliding motility-associated protein GldE [Bacteroidota bacterium]